MTLKKLACRRVQKLTPYQSARRIGGVGRIYLNANENPLSINYELDSSVYNRYPDCQPQEVLQAYLDGKSYQEIADALGRHVKSIDNALQRVKRKLEKYLEEKWV